MTDVPLLPHPKSMSSDHQASAVGRASLGLEQVGGPRAGSLALGSGEVTVEAGVLREWGVGKGHAAPGQPRGRLPQKVWWRGNTRVFWKSV